MMRNVFPLTPVIAHERLTTEEGRDNFIGARRSIIDKLLMREGPELLACETSSRDKTVISFVYLKNGILQEKTGGFIMDKPSKDIYPAMNAVWGEVEKAIENSKREQYPMMALVSTLKKPPYGMRTRSISLIVAAVFRQYILRGNLAFEYRKSPSNIEHITNINGEVLDNAVMSAESYTLIYNDVSEKQKAILFGIATAFDVPYESEEALSRIEWVTHLC